MDFQELYQHKQEKLLKLFQDSLDPQVKYTIIMELGRTLPTCPKELMTEANIVKGCQSTVYLASHFQEDGTLQFLIHSDALISSGLAALLLFIYDKEPVEFIIHSPPLFIKELGLHSSLTPGRSNGLLSMYSRMKQEALKHFLIKQYSSNPKIV